jgi:hypothetical protein
VVKETGTHLFNPRFLLPQLPEGIDDQTWTSNKWCDLTIRVDGIDISDQIPGQCQFNGNHRIYKDQSTKYAVCSADFQYYTHFVHISVLTSGSSHDVSDLLIHRPLSGWCTNT